MVNLVKHDLEFILKQIKIAEAHAEGEDLTSLIAAASGVDADTLGPSQAHLLPYGLRTVDGSYNNLVPGRENWGAADQQFLSLNEFSWKNESDDRMMFGTPANAVWLENNDYESSGGIPGPTRLANGDIVDADPRHISNLIVDQTLNNPAVIIAALEHLEYDGDMDAAVTAVQTAHAAVEAATPVGPGEPTPEQTAALEAAQANLDAVLESYGIEMDGPSVFLPNVSPDIGDSASYNSIFTLFGQFFDHGLDLVAKGGNGTIYMPLSSDDPLYNPATPHTNFMVLTRASIGEDARNTTTPWVDQNQTYGSHASKQVFMREYAEGSDGKPVATGHLLEGSTGGANGEKGGMATWADVKAQAANILGIKLTDADVGNIPLIAADEYGNFIPGANGFAQLVVGLGADGILGTADDVLVEGNPLNPVDPSTAVNPETGAVGAFRTGHAFLDDIAHAAATVNSRGQVLIADADDAQGITLVLNPNYDANYTSLPATHLLETSEYVARNPAFNAGADPSATNPEYVAASRLYDNELLDAHFITGDGRGNENIGLTAIHHVFHGEHNLIVEQTKALVLESGDLDFLNEWLLEPVDAFPADGFDLSTLVWNGERIFQTGRFVTEMEYQHLVFEEFARKMQPDVDAFLFEPDPDINPAIFAEFANVVYRFGHSMLNETVDRVSADGIADDMSLFEAFLNPIAYDTNGTLTHDQAAGAVIRGMSNQLGNEIDEFVTNTLRNQLLGIPLDLAAINIARGRDTGMPTLNEARAQFQDMAYGDSQLDPYASWTDFALNMKNPASIVNFIAAYGTHQTIVDATTIEGKRDAAMAIVFGGDGAPADRVDFLNATGTYATAELGGLQNIDLWMGGLAEKKMDFGGMLGSTFSFVFELQMENLQDGDRFYYLSRAQGLNLLSELEGNSLAKMMLRNTDLAEEGTAIPGDIFSTPGLTLYLDHAKQIRMTGLDDPEHDNAALEAISNMVERRDQDGEVVSLEAAGMPAGMTFDADTSGFSGTPTVGGRFEVTVTATFSSGTTASHAVKFAVVAAEPIIPAHLDALVDDAHYNTQYPDVALANVDPDAHYAQFGWGEGRDPNPWFSTTYYLTENPDVAEAGINPLVHYLQYGWREGRDPSPDFDIERYLQAYPDVAAAGVDPLTHYIMSGRAQGLPIFAAEPNTHLVLVAGQAFSHALPTGLFATDGVAEYLRYNGGDHVVIQGTNDADHIIAGEGDDTIWGGDGDDRLDGGYGVDHVHGGDGDDIILNAGTDIGAMDFLHGEAGNDVINGGSGLSLLFGNEGHDFLVAGPDGKTVMGGIDDDYILGGNGIDMLMGEAGDDWMEGGDRFDTLAGENSELFFNSTIIGHDVLNGQQGDTDYDAESGDDIMFQGIGIQRNNGMAGFDWAIHKGDAVAANSDLGIRIFQNQEEFILRDRFDLVEGLSGWMHDDILRGRSSAPGARDEQIGGAAIPAPDDPFLSWSNALTAGGVARVAGFDEIVGHIDYDNTDNEHVVMETGDGSDILFGGGGSDLITGEAGDDILDGDRWVNVRISIRNASGEEIATADGMTGKMYASPAALAAKDDTLLFGAGKTVQQAVFDRTIGPAQLFIVREILSESGDDDADTAGYTDVVGNYTFEVNADGSLVVDHTRFGDQNPAVDDDDDTEAGEGEAAPKPMADGRDTLRNVEKLNFTDGDVNVIMGTNGDDRGSSMLNGTDAADLIIGLAGDDNIQTAGGNDIAFGSDGDDRLVGSDGNDNLDGGSGTDTLLGNGGDDQLFGGTGVDSLTGGLGNDALNGGEGDDTLIGNSGDDTLDGGAGDDDLDGGADADILTGRAGSDTLFGNIGDDTLVTEVDGGRDFLDGGNQTDTAEILGSVDVADVFRILARANAVAEGHDLTALTEIVIVRNGVVIAELDNIEEIVIDGQGGGDSFTIVGDFAPTTLATSTIRIEGSTDDETVDMSALASAHRVVFRPNGGNDTVVGALRDQDDVLMGNGSSIRNHDAVEDGEGGSTVSVGGNTVQFGGYHQPEEEPAVDDDDDVHHDGDDDDSDRDDDDHDDDEGQSDSDDDDVPPVPSGSLTTGGNGADALTGTAADEVFMAHDNRDVILAGDGDDDVFGGSGADMLYGDEGNDRVFAGQGDDLVTGGRGSDTVFGGEGSDLIVATRHDGSDTYYGGEITDLCGSDTLDVSAITANITADLGTGFMGRGHVSSSLSGSDTLWGIENIITGSGDDTITASSAANVFDAGDGEDTFRFLSAADADGDTIASFQVGDRLDLSAVDANGSAAENGSFTLVSEGLTGARGELLVSHESEGSEDFTIVSGDTTGDGNADFRITVKGSHELDFNL